jgi:hypothetical protein
VIPILDKKHVLGERLEVRIGKQGRLEYVIFKHPMLVLRRHVLLLEFFMPFPIER